MVNPVVRRLMGAPSTVRSSMALVSDLDPVAAHRLVVRLRVAPRRVVSVIPRAVLADPVASAGRAVRRQAPLDQRPIEALAEASAN